MGNGKVEVIEGNPSARQVVEPDPTIIPEAAEAGVVPPPAEQRSTVSIGDLIRQCNEASSKMSVGNPNKRLILTCAYAMQQLVQRLEFHENKARQQ